MCSRTRVKAIWGKRCKKSGLGNECSFRKPREVPSPQAGYASVRLFDRFGFDNYER